MVDMMKDKHVINETNAETIWGWLKERGGVSMWRSIDLSDPTASWITPRLTEAGEPASKPSWKAEPTPHRIISSADEIEVSRPVELKRIKAIVRRGAQGFSLKLTDACTRRVREAVDTARAKHGVAWFEIDYFANEVVILTDGEVTPLREFIAAHANRRESV
jgi:hypothetical protein